VSETSRAFNFFSPLRFGILLAVLICATFPQVIAGWETFVARDYGFFAYPLAHFQRDCFWRGEIPFWDPYNNCGVPFLAQWNTMALYPPALIYLLLPLPWSLGFFSLLHLWFGGMGMYWLARRWTKNDFAAAFAGTVFAFNGLTLNLLTWPSHTATFAWMPWVVLAVELAWRDANARRRAGNHFSDVDSAARAVASTIDFRRCHAARKNVPPFSADRRAGLFAFRRATAAVP
jgi:hypothetical protein